MKPTSHHYIALIIAVVILVASIAGYFFIHVQVGEQTVRTAKAFAAVSVDRTVAAQEQSASSSLSSTADARALLETYLIPDDETVFFIEQVEGVSKQSGATVSIASISADDLTSAPPGTTGHIQAHISINGSWPQAMRALHIIEDLPYSVSMDNITGRATGGGIWDIEFNLVSIIQK